MKYQSLKKMIQYSGATALVLIFMSTSIAQESTIGLSENNRPNQLMRGPHIFNPTDDSFVGALYEINGAGLTLNLRNGSVGDNYLAAPVLKFDISTIPANSFVISATLKLFYFDFSDNNPAGRALTMRRFEGNWNEETIMRSNMPTYSNEISAITNAPSTTGVWVAWDVTDDVQEFLSESMENYGWIIKDEQYWGGSGIPLMYFHSKEYGSNIPYLEIVVNEPPAVPQITGQANGSVDTSYDFTFIGSDPDGDQIYYTIEWGDGQTNIWIGPYPSGQPLTIPHSWAEKGTYTIRAKVKDTHDAESDWETLEVTMPFSSNNINLHFLETIFERFPHLFPIILYMLGY